VNENDIINKYITLKNRSLNLNDSLNINEKISILSLISKCVRKNLTSIDTIFLSTNCNFGNCLVVLNN
jgi:hypothetical protein